MSSLLFPSVSFRIDAARVSAMASERFVWGRSVFQRFVSACSYLGAGNRKKKASSRGAVMIMAVYIAIALTGALWFMVGTAEALIYRDRVQEAADAVAFSTAVVQAKGMNLIACINAVMLAIVGVYLIVALITMALHLVFELILGICAGLTLVTFGEIAEGCKQTLDQSDNLAERFEKLTELVKKGEGDGHGRPKKGSMKGILPKLGALEAKVAWGFPFAAEAAGVTTGAEYGKLGLTLSPTLIPAQAGASITLDDLLLEDRKTDPLGYAFSGSFYPDEKQFDNLSSAAPEDRATIFKEADDGHIAGDAKKRIILMNHRIGLPVVNTSMSSLCTTAGAVTFDLIASWVGSKSEVGAVNKNLPTKDGTTATVNASPKTLIGSVLSGVFAAKVGDLFCNRTGRSMGSAWLDYDAGGLAFSLDYFDPANSHLRARMRELLGPAAGLGPYPFWQVRDHNDPEFWRSLGPKLMWPLGMNGTDWNQNWTFVKGDWNSNNSHSIIDARRHVGIPAGQGGVDMSPQATASGAAAAGGGDDDDPNWIFYTAQSEFYFDCDTRWFHSGCNSNWNHAVFAPNWRGRLKRMQKPDPAQATFDVLIGHLFGSPAVATIAGKIPLVGNVINNPAAKGQLRMKVSALFAKYNPLQPDAPTSLH